MPANDEGEDDRGPGEADRLPDDHEDAGADDGADAEGRQVQEPDDSAELGAVRLRLLDRGPRAACAQTALWWRSHHLLDLPIGRVPTRCLLKLKNGPIRQKVPATEVAYSITCVKECS